MIEPYTIEILFVYEEIAAFYAFMRILNLNKCVECT